ncbi:MAG: phage head-tail connector protein [Clostridia bacterium]|nr:phage head-tail connector protein [Clostridia bacterium]
MEHRNLPQLKTLLRLEDMDTERDALLSLLLVRAEDTARVYCRLREDEAVPEDLILRMAAEDYTQLGSEGISYKSYSGINETYRSEYSGKVIMLLNRYRRLAVI